MYNLRSNAYKKLRENFFICILSENDMKNVKRSNFNMLPEARFSRLLYRFITKQNRKFSLKLLSMLRRSLQNSQEK